MASIKRPKISSRVKLPHRVSKLSFSEQFFPARPERLWKSTKKLALTPIGSVQKIGLPVAANAAYVRWLKKESMLQTANRLAAKYSGGGSMWRNPFARPQPRRAVQKAGVWYTAYPISLITKTDQSILSSLAEPALWKAFQTIGIQAIHTGPMKLAGGIDGWKTTPSVDGHFDRISNRLDPALGTESQFRHLSVVAREHDGIVIDDIVPGHTGKGTDFRLAEMNYGEYPGIYHMVEIKQTDWDILPAVPRGRDSVNLNHEVEAVLKDRGYIVGKLPRVIFYEPGIKDTNWSVTKIVRGTDGVRRRWVYLHYFKDGQPSINWLDPSFAGMKLVIGDALHSIGELGSQGLRLDANGFLGIEKGSEDEPAWSEGHPLSEAANLMIAGTVRKLGGFTFQELNLSMDDIKSQGRSGADLSYDFINRPAYHHAICSGDTEFLRICMNESLNLGIDPASLVHALQNHDEITTELVHFWTIHKDDEYDYRGKTLKGSDLRLQVRKELHGKLTDGLDYNLPFLENGVACTTASVVTAALGIKNPYAMSADQRDQTQKAHLLLAMFNAWQPGVFALSGWDLVGALPLPAEKVKSLMADGDSRWINRGSYDMLDSRPGANASDAGMPKAHTLYGSLPEQLSDDNSFASQLQTVIAIRNKHGIATAHQLAIPPVAHKSMLVMLHCLANKQLQLTVLNFGPETIAATVTADELVPGTEVVDASSQQVISTVDDLHNFQIALEPFQGRFLLLK